MFIFLCPKSKLSPAPLQGELSNPGCFWGPRHIAHTQPYQASPCCSPRLLVTRTHCEPATVSSTSHSSTSTHPCHTGVRESSFAMGSRSFSWSHTTSLANRPLTKSFWVELRLSGATNGPVLTYAYLSLPFLICTPAQRGLPFCKLTLFLRGGETGCLSRVLRVFGTREPNI